MGGIPIALSGPLDVFVAVASSQFPGTLPACSALNHNIASDMLSSGPVAAVGLLKYAKLSTALL